MQAMAAAGLAVALLAGLLALAGAGAAYAQEPVPIQAEVTTQQEPTTEEATCEAVDLGMLDSTPGSTLMASGRWTAQDCDSRFRANSDAHTYRFEIAATGRIRVDVMSAEADSYLYLLDEGGNRISENDDGGVSALDARFERELEAGVYLVEATTTAGRVRGPADFEVVVTVVATCDPEALGVLTSGQEIEVTGFWTPESCQSIFLTGHPSQYFVFTLPEGARVRVDLTSEIGDPVLIVAPIVALRAVVPGQVAHNDDSRGTQNSRIEQYFPPDVYGIEATTFRNRDRQGSQVDFTLTLAIVEEEAQQNSPQLKIEDIDIPTEVVAGDPLTVNFRVGNVGGDEFPDPASNAILYAVGPRVFDRAAPLFARHWPAGVSYHTNVATASATSTTTPQVAPFSVTFNRIGPTWLFTAVLVSDGENEELGFHGLWHDLMVLSAPTYNPVLVEVDGAVYSVSAELPDMADEGEEGTVVTTVSSVDDPEAEIDLETQEKAQFAAGVRTQMLDGIFDRPGLAELSGSAEPVEVAVAGPASSTLLKALLERLTDALDASELPERRAAGEATSPILAEKLVLAMAEAASAEYAALAKSWRALLGELESGEALSFEDAVAVQSQLAHAEHVLGPMMRAGDIVYAAQVAELGWDDPEVLEMLSGQPGCHTGDEPLGDALAFAGIEDTDTLVALDTELRAALFAYIVSVDGVLCAIENADAANSRFLERLDLGHSELLLKLIKPEALPALEEEPEPALPIQLRIMARFDEDGRVEHGVELNSGYQIQPMRRFLPDATQVGMWYTTSDVELDGISLGAVRSRRLADGRIEVGFRDSGGGIIGPDLAYLSDDFDKGVWYRSSLIDVPPPPESAEDGVESG